MRKLLLVGFALCVVGLSVGALSRPAFAVDVTGGQTGSVCTNQHATSQPAICQDTTGKGGNPLFGANGVLTLVVNILSLIIGATSVIIIIISGLRLILSGGDAGTVAGARMAIIYALIGVAVAISAQIIVAFILNKI